MTRTCLRSIVIPALALLPAAKALGAESAEGAGGPSLFTGDLGNIFWSLLTFAAVIFVLGKFAWKPILGALQKREDFIRDSLKKATKPVPSRLPLIPVTLLQRTFLSGANPDTRLC